MKPIRLAEICLGEREWENVRQVLQTRQLSQGRFVRRMEQQLCEVVHAQHCIAVSNGTVALHAALLALGVSRGDRVVVPACSYIATANAVAYCGAIPVFVDVDVRTWMLDSEQAIDAVRRVDACGILSVNLYGRRCPVPTIPGVWVLEDSCEAHGLQIVGDVSVLSFYGNKIVSCGEGGAILTNDPDVAENCRKLRGQGQSEIRYVHDTLGYNYRLTDLQAAVAVGQIEGLEAALEVRAILQGIYLRYLLPYCQAITSDNVAWVFPIRVNNRDAVAKALADEGVETRPVFPALHEQPIYDTGDCFPVAEELGRKGLVLPLHTMMTPEDVANICKIVLSVAEPATVQTW